MDQALVQDPQHQVDGQQREEDQDRLILQGGLEGLGGPLEAGPHAGRQPQLALDGADGVDGLAQRDVGGQVE